MAMLTLPPLRQVPSPNQSARASGVIDLIVVHDCEGSYAGSINWFFNPASQVSAHLVLKEDGSEATQCVPFARKAWACCDFNSRSISVEMAGMAKVGYGENEWLAAAAIVAWLLHKYDIPCRWAEHGEGAGFCSHYDLGAAGGGHSDPTTDASVWAAFVARVERAYAEMAPGAWAWHGDPPPSSIVSPPDPPAGFAPTLNPRGDSVTFTRGSVSWIQTHLNFSGARLAVDGAMGPETIRAIKQFQFAHKLTVDGIAGPATIAALGA